MRSGRARAGDMCMQNLHISAHTHTHIYMPYKSHRSSMELCVSIPRQTSMLIEEDLNLIQMGMGQTIE